MAEPARVVTCPVCGRGLKPTTVPHASLASCGLCAGMGRVSEGRAAAWRLGGYPAVLDWERAR